MTDTYLVVDARTGGADYATRDAGEARDAAAYIARKRKQKGFGWAAPARLPNPPECAAPHVSPTKALALAGLRPHGIDEVMGLSLEQAWERVQPLYRQVTTEGSWNKYQDLLRPGKGLLRQNQKLLKSKTGATHVAGLSLLPESAAFAGESALEAEIEHLGGEPKLLPLGPMPGSWPRKNTFCAGSSHGCRVSCLINTGNNVSEIRAVMIKQVQSQALVLETAAFLRLLVEAVYRYLWTRKGVQKYIRLNTLSDIPWEVLMPWFFSDPRMPWVEGMHRGVGQFFWKGQPHLLYDYTKLAGRNPPWGYDLSFSFSGVNWNLVKCELERGFRAVFVFVPSNVKLTAHKRKFPIPKTWAPPKLGGKTYEVVSGDEDDIRPRDPTGVIVGLRWKLAKSQWNAERASTFVIRGQVVPDVRTGEEVFVTAETPNQDGGFAFEPAA